MLLAGCGSAPGWLGWCVVALAEYRQSPESAVRTEADSSALALIPVRRVVGGGLALGAQGGGSVSLDFRLRRETTPMTTPTRTVLYVHMHDHSIYKQTAQKKPA